MPILLALVAIACAPLLAAEAAGPTTVAVIMDFDGEHSDASLEEMKREFESIMRPSGLSFDWRILDDSVTREYFTHLVVTRFKGACRPLPQEDEESEAGALGLTHVSDGDVLPFSELDCDRIRRLIQGQLEGKSLPRRTLLLGRALGRVLAHEIYHMLADTRKHGGGVAKPVLAPRELVDGSLALEEPQARLIRKKFHLSGWQQASTAGREQRHQ